VCRNVCNNRAWGGEWRMHESDWNNRGQVVSKWRLTTAKTMMILVSRWKVMATDD
jgi:hypothetical protein